MTTFGLSCSNHSYFNPTALRMGAVGLNKLLVKGLLSLRVNDLLSLTVLTTLIEVICFAEKW